MAGLIGIFLFLKLMDDVDIGKTPEQIKLLMVVGTHCVWTR